MSVKYNSIVNTLNTAFVGFLGISEYDPPMKLFPTLMLSQSKKQKKNREADYH